MRAWEGGRFSSLDRRYALERGSHLSLLSLLSHLLSSPLQAFNFDPVNTPRQQAAFGRHMRPLVEEAGMLYIDNYPSTYDAVFQGPPHAIKFAKNSAFHYLNAGRYLMAQIMLHTLKMLAPSATALAG